MAGNSQRKGAVRKRGKGTGQGNTAGSGGRIRRSLEGRGPTPKAEDRPYHKAYRKTGSSQGQQRAPRAKRSGRAGPEWVAGRNPVLEALRADLPVRQLHVAEGIERDDRIAEILKTAAARSIPLLQTTRHELDRLTDGAVHQGVALQLPAYEYADPADILDAAIDSDAPALVVVLDAITDPRNLGAIIRSAAAFGAVGVVIPERRAASVTAAAWKTSAGAAARLPIARATNLNRSLETFAKAGFTIVGLAGEAETDLAAVDLSDPVVLVVGSEETGLSRLVREHCDVLASIPISSAIESLNAGVAAGIALYEIARARG
ncbi:23S rRNA (guanosine(2251)-2'-O)-methyltransferase RlmB [Propionicicella superfundia]|uniref:23S rRNA (guanosine(2251)-2'-O)-methyltransferase RlmB n=1 Tax=Propionicicella superfundia TaxID=348582 RepID=UPI0003FC7140|nr:23S rRNA (guanosine(2251)-2'-O)-methyltransferase RlmB [Propionicicella superfundia]